MVQAANMLNYQNPCSDANDDVILVNAVDEGEIDAVWTIGIAPLWC